MEHASTKAERIKAFVHVGARAQAAEITVIAVAIARPFFRVVGKLVPSDFVAISEFVWEWDLVGSEFVLGTMYSSKDPMHQNNVGHRKMGG